MKRVRVAISTTCLLLVLMALCLIPVPISRIRGHALIQADPEHSSQIVLKRSALLVQLKVRPGDMVTKGTTLAIFRDPDLEEKVAQVSMELKRHSDALRSLEKQKNDTTDSQSRRRYEEEIVHTYGLHETAKATLQALRRVQDEELLILAPRDGIVGQAPRQEDIGKLFEGARDQPQTQPILTIHELGKLRACLPLTTSDYNRLAHDLKSLSAKNERTGEDEALWINMRVLGLDASTFPASIDRLDESEAKFIPYLLSNRANGPVAVHPPNPRSPGLIPQTQHYLVYLNIDAADPAITVGALAQVKIYLQPETCLHWAWRTINDLFNLRLM